MNKPRIIFRIFLLLLGFLASPCWTAERPNVIFILADDLGWADTTLYGQTKFYQTPHLERLASQGMTFTRAYAASPLCSPTRSSILTGLHPARTGITTPNCHLAPVILRATAGKSAPPDKPSIEPIPPTRLDTTYLTLATSLKKEGYATGHFGKWHLGHEPYSPLQHGFDIDIPHWPGPGPAGSFVAPWKYPDFDPATPKEHIEDRMAHEAVQFMEQNKDKPFFLNYWMFSVHAPFDAKASLIAKYKKSAIAGAPQSSPTYAAMVESMDDAVGTLLDAVDRLDLTRRTIVIFFSDNGGNMYNEIDGTTPTSNHPLRGGKATVFEGGIRVPCIVSWPGHIAAKTQNHDLIQSTDFFPTLLDLLQIAPSPSQIFDGHSFGPALKGEALPPKPIFTYFPHNPAVPDWLPPSVCVHDGDWKLIRIFHGGTNGKHRWKLFHLKDDIGETKDLSGQFPEKVAELDKSIEAFLTRTQAVVPTRNPTFDQALCREENEGKATNRVPKKAKSTPAVPDRPNKKTSNSTGSN